MKNEQEETREEKISRARLHQGRVVDAIERALQTASRFKATSSELQEASNLCQKAMGHLTTACNVMGDVEKMGK